MNECEDERKHAQDNSVHSVPSVIQVVEAPSPERLRELEGKGITVEVVDTLQSVDTSNVEPMANPHDATQQLRTDEVTERNRRDDFQAIAPAVEDGLFLVPRVIE